jgi:hypothetical protein
MDYDSGSLQDLIIQNIKDVKQFMAEEKAEGDKWVHFTLHREQSNIFFFQGISNIGALFNRSIERRGRQPTVHATATIPDNTTKGPLETVGSLDVDGLLDVKRNLLRQMQICFRRVEKPCRKGVLVSVECVLASNPFRCYCRILHKIAASKIHTPF